MKYVQNTIDTRVATAHLKVQPSCPLESFPFDGLVKHVLKPPHKRTMLHERQRSTKDIINHMMHATDDADGLQKLLGDDAEAIMKLARNNKIAMDALSKPHNINTTQLLALKDMLKISDHMWPVLTEAFKLPHEAK